MIPCNIELEEYALMSIMQSQEFDMYKSVYFTEERRYLFELIVATYDKYKMINEVVAEMVHKEKGADIAYSLRNDCTFIAVSWSYVESVFKKSWEGVPVNQAITPKLVEALSDLEKQRRYREVILEISRKTQAGIYTPMEDVMALEPFTVTSTNKARNLIERMPEYREMEGSQIISLGDEFLDSKTSFLKGNITAIAGDTASLKTTSALWFVIKMLIANPTYTAIFFEKEVPINDIITSIISFFTRVNKSEIIRDKEVGIRAIEQYLNGNHPDGKSAIVIDILSRLKLVATTEFGSIEDMANYIEAEKPDIFVLDFLTQMFEGTTASDLNIQVMNGGNKLKRIVHKTGAAGIILCQLKKNTVEQRLLKIPSIDDMEWSGTIKQIAASIFMTFFPKLYYEKSMEEKERSYFYLCCKKNRYEQTYEIPFIASPGINRLDKPENEKVQKWLDNHIKQRS